MCSPHMAPGIWLACYRDSTSESHSLVVCAGSLPPDWAALSNIEELDLSSNAITGTELPCSSDFLWNYTTTGH